MVASVGPRFFKDRLLGMGLCNAIEANKEPNKTKVSAMFVYVVLSAIPLRF
jgi:hypothetical protein